LGGNGDSRLLKILHIDPERNWGGGEAQVFGLLNYLSGRGHHNVLLAHPNGALFERCRQLNLKTHPFSMRNDLDLRPVPALRSLIHSEDFDIVHLHTKRAHALSLWLPRAKTRPKYVVTRRMDYPERRGWYSHWLYNKRVDGVVAISQAIGDLLVQAGVNRSNIRRISSGVDPERFKDDCSRRDGSNRVKTIGCIAGFEARKGQRFLLEAAASLKAQGFKLQYQLAGDGPLRTELENHAMRLGLRDEVSFLGFVADTPAFLADIDLFVMPSLFEGLGVAVLEAMAVGKPVIATRVGGLAESVIDGVTGILVPASDGTALASAIAKLARAPTLAAEMGRCGRARVLQHFTLDHMARQNESYYYELLS
jgi:glycosyltransferase involved in cell wall biosynthesis